VSAAPPGFQTPPPPNASSTTTPKRSPLLAVAIAIGALVVVFLVCGVLAAIAIPAFINYVKRSKAAEAPLQLQMLSRSAQDACRRTGAFPPAGPQPITVGPEKRIGAFGSDPGFVELGFSPTEPLYYRYQVTPTADGAVLVAEGDLDGDGVFSRFELRCYAHCACDPTPSVTHELE
jgi:type II secretory pathway pseudopilin PulG